MSFSIFPLLPSDHLVEDMVPYSSEVLAPEEVVVCSDFFPLGISPELKVVTGAVAQPFVSFDVNAVNKSCASPRVA